MIPDHMMGAIRRYVDDGLPPGSFLEAVITNNLRDAVAYADATNINLLPEYVRHFYNDEPSGCWGSEANMQEWMAGVRA